MVVMWFVATSGQLRRERSAVRGLLAAETLYHTAVITVSTSCFVQLGSGSREPMCRVPQVSVLCPARARSCVSCGKCLPETDSIVQTNARSNIQKGRPGKSTLESHGCMNLPSNATRLVLENSIQRLTVASFFYSASHSSAALRWPWPSMANSAASLLDI